MRWAMLVGIVVVGLCGPAKAFDFQPDDFAVRYAEEAKRQARTSHLNLGVCERKFNGGCEYQSDGDSVVKVIGNFNPGQSKTVAMLLTIDTAIDRALLLDAPFILTAIASPDASVEERRAVISKIIPSSIVDGAEPRFAMVGPVKYTAAVIAGPVLVLGAIDTRLP